MKYKTLKQALHAVDPHLTVVSGGRHHRKDSMPRVTMNNLDWEASTGAPCPKCGCPEVRFVKGVCRECHTRQRQKLAKTEASLNPLVYECKDKKLASRVQKYLAKLDRKA